MMTRGATLIAAGLAAATLSGCLTMTHTDLPLWAHFDACADRTAFHDWVMCAKVNREATCSTSRACALGWEPVLFHAESLDRAVARREISETEARRRWTEYRIDRDRAIARAAAEAAEDK
jgi:hydroxypyruvate isomerase